MYTLDQMTRKQARFGNLNILDFLSIFEKADQKSGGKVVDKDIAHTRTLLDKFEKTLLIKDIMNI